MEGVQLLFTILGAGLKPSFCEHIDALLGCMRQALLNGRLRAAFSEDPQVIQHGRLRLWSSAYMEIETSRYWVKCYFNVQTYLKLARLKKDKTRHKRGTCCSSFAV